MILYASNMGETVHCPFCGFKSTEAYLIQLHVEEHHTEDSPFVIVNSLPPPKASSSRNISSDEASDSEDSPWVKCTRPGCGEYVLISDIDDHLELHEATAISAEGAKDSKSQRSPASHGDVAPRSPPRGQQRPHQARRPSSSISQTSRSVRDYFIGSSSHGRQSPPRHRRIREPSQPGRLGKRELGPHAFEKRMPDEVRRRLIRDAEPRYTNRIGRDGRLFQDVIVENETSGLIPILADLCSLDRTTVATYFCDASVRHVVKIRCDGNFCGYWNIQMLLSYLQSQRPSSGNGDRADHRLVPNIPQIQDTIEHAWDHGICSYGRIETGGVRDTRKWIGSHEALAYFTQIGVDVDALAFREEEGDTSSPPAVMGLLEHIEAYFISALETAKTHGTSHITLLPPVYFQRFGHSMTIVGLERKRDGSRNLIMFDPSFATSAPMGRLLAGRQAHALPETLLKPYRRSDHGLSRWEEFEIIV